jgi:PncC family amidohydrolase
VTATPPTTSQGEDREVPPEVRLNRLLGDSRRLTIAAAESCSGGEVAHRITSVAGSSVYFLGSVVSYSNEAKVSLLGVSPEILTTRGAVSDECARAMAEGARQVFGADVAVSTTGIAGPGGATARKPVGLVYIAVADGDGVDSLEHHFAGNRNAVIDAAAAAALRSLLERVERSLDRRTECEGASVA